MPHAVPARVLLSALLAGVAAADLPTVALPYGEVRGNPLASVDEFLGIPYALPPLGEQRFAAPQPWAGPYPEGGLDGTKARAACMQLSTGVEMWFQPGHVPVSEDCLFLNVYRPRAQPRGNASHSGTAPPNQTGMPVMLWIHGGSLQFGTGVMPSYNATALAAQEGILVVTINYRLNVFGFAPVISPSGPVANNGWRDQRMAMRWVQKHIAEFGGDSSRVTLFGESAGGQSVFVHLLSPSSAGLFSGAISQSGDLSMMTSLDEGLKNTQRIALEAGCAGPADLPCLRKLSAESLLQASVRLPHPMGVIDGDVLPGRPQQLLEEGRFNKGVPYIAGWNEHDAKTFTYPGVTFPAESGSPLSKEQAQCVFTEAFGKNAQRVIDVYPPRASAGVFDNREVMSELYTDLIFGCPNNMAATTLAAKSASVWVYSFQRRPSCSPTMFPGPAHGSEIAYVFGNQEEMAEIHTRSTSTSCQVSPHDKALSRTMMGLWAAFARSGKPPAQWPRWDVQTQSALKLEMATSSRLLTETGIRSGQCQVLRSLGVRALDGAARLGFSLLKCQRSRKLAEERAPVFV